MHEDAQLKSEETIKNLESTINSMRDEIKELSTLKEDIRALTKSI